MSDNPYQAPLAPAPFRSRWRIVAVLLLLCTGAELLGLIGSIPLLHSWLGDITELSWQLAVLLVFGIGGGVVISTTIVGAILASEKAYRNEWRASH